MELTLHYLYPVDLDTEMDPDPAQRRYAREVLRENHSGEAVFEGARIGVAQMVGYLYPFGVGMLEIILPYRGDLSYASRLAVEAEKILIGKYPLLHFFSSQKERILAKAQMFAKARPAAKSNPETPSEIFTLILAAPEHEKTETNAFIRKNEKMLFGIVTGEPSYSELSEYALEKESLKNIGYYEDEIIFIKRYGAFIRSKEETTLKDLIALALAQYFNVKSANSLLEASLVRAQTVLEDQPPYYRFWKIPGAYQRLSVEQAAFSKAKIALVDGLHTAHIQIPAIDSDWHLKSVHQEILSAFDLEAQAKTAMTRLETVDTIYSHLGEQLATAFFIILDFVFVTWLLVDLVGWIALLIKMK